ncbi:hypothetical protein [Halopiger djelfimassiliensis]|uniref:hypothetical protein n=1 Tax=Halopiger djelfimassiliensis TaxID=1293047 RepID=UPI0006782181|nr:hypothetical protein [Halopiger djelfimassiliensis]
MTDADRPTRPTAADPELLAALEVLEDRDAETLRTVTRYLGELVAWKERRAAPDRAGESAGDERTPDEYPADVPERATVSETVIDGTEYRYYQWREGDEIRSKTERL